MAVMQHADMIDAGAAFVWLFLTVGAAIALNVVAVRRGMTFRQAIPAGMIIAFGSLQLLCLWVLGMTLATSLVGGAIAAFFVLAYARAMVWFAGAVRRTAGKGGLDLDSVVTWFGVRNADEQKRARPDKPA